MKSRILFLVIVTAIIASSTTAMAQSRLKRFQQRLDEIKSMFEDDDGEDGESAKELERPDAPAPTPAEPPASGLSGTFPHPAPMGARLHPASDGQGLIVSNIQPGGPAHQAGLQNGDRLVSIGEFPLDRYEDWQEVEKSIRPGDHIEVDVVRGQQRGKVVIGFQPAAASPLSPRLPSVPQEPHSQHNNYGPLAPGVSFQPAPPGTNLINAPPPPRIQGTLSTADPPEGGDDDQSRRPFSVLHKLSDQLTFSRSSRSASEQATPEQIQQLRQTIETQRLLILQLQQQIQSLRSSTPLDHDPALAPPGIN